jgi:hypothetical protein
MTVQKVTVSLDPAVAERARQDVAAGRARSMSAWLNDAGRDRVERDDLAAVLHEILAETGGAPTADELSRAERRMTAARDR